MTTTPNAGEPLELEQGTIVGGDGYASHADCDPDDALGDLSEDGELCWICGEEL